MPASAGNREEVLPPGVVCDTCNRNWRKIEVELREFSLFKIGAWAVHSENVYTGKPLCPVLTDDAGTVIPTPGYGRGNIRLGIRVKPLTLRVEVTTQVTGTFTTHYTERRLRFLSRAIHKVAFEGLAWGMYVRHNQPTPIVDPFSPYFDQIRRWAQSGAPQGENRPFLMPVTLGATVNLNQVTFGPTIHASRSGMIVQYRDGFSWYAVSLIDTAAEGVAELLRWARNQGHSQVLMIGDRFAVVNLKSPQEVVPPTA